MKNVVAQLKFPVVSNAVMSVVTMAHTRHVLIAPVEARWVVALAWFATKAKSRMQCATDATLIPIPCYAEMSRVTTCRVQLRPCPNCVPLSLWSDSKTNMIPRSSPLMTLASFHILRTSTIWLLSTRLEMFPAALPRIER